VKGEDGGSGISPGVCIFHSRGASNCCLFRTGASKRSGGSRARRSAVHGTFALDDLKGVPGMDAPNTITTEITSGPRPDFKTEDVEGSAPKARKLLGLFRRESIDEKKKGDDEDNVGLHERATMPSRNAAVGETDPNGITVQYDVTRTVEDMMNGELSNHDCPDCIACMKEETCLCNGDIV
jgi:hypothetical protein